MERKFGLGDYVSAVGVVVYFAFMLISFVMLLVSMEGGWGFVAFNKIILLLLGVGAGLVLVMSLRQPAVLNLLLAFSAMVLVLRFLHLASLGAGVGSDAGLDFWYLLGAFAVGAGSWMTKKELEEKPAVEKEEEEETKEVPEGEEAAAEAEEKAQSEEG
jgi:hypothetical protein